LQVNIKILTSIILFLLIILFIKDIFYSGQDRQWDLKVYYYSALANTIGLNPYDIKQVSQLSSVKYKYVYLPTTLYFFKAFNIFEYNIIKLLYPIFQLLLLLFLLLLWKNYFLDNNVDLLFYLFCFFAFNSAVLIDFVTGNIAILEQLFLWSAFYFLLTRRYLVFCILIVFISLFKITPVLFLFLLFLFKTPNRIKYFIYSSLSFVIIVAFNVFFKKLLFLSFVDNVLEMNYGGISNPTSFYFFKDIISIILSYLGIYYYENIFILTYFIFIILILLIVKKVYIHKLVLSNPKLYLYFFLLVYALILPRFMSYSYILLIVPAYYAIKKIQINNKSIIAFIFILTSIISIPGFLLLNDFWKIFWNYYPFILSLFLFIVYYTKLDKLRSVELEETN
jgi:hypothetical protein